MPDQVSLKLHREYAAELRFLFEQLAAAGVTNANITAQITAIGRAIANGDALESVGAVGGPFMERKQGDDGAEIFIVDFFNYPMIFTYHKHLSVIYYGYRIDLS